MTAVTNKAGIGAGHLTSNPLSEAEPSKPKERSELAEKMVFYPVIATDVQDISIQFKMVELQGEWLKTAAWNPGEKMKVQLGNLARSYTPMFVDKESGKVQFLIHLHGNGPGSAWASHLKKGDAAYLSEARKSLSFPPKTSEVIFFGDETTFGIAHVVKTYCEGARFLFETSSVEGGQKVLSHRCITDGVLFEKEQGAAHLTKVTKQILEIGKTYKDPKVILMGNEQSIAKVKKMLGEEGFPLGNCTTKSHWSAMQRSKL